MIIKPDTIIVRTAYLEELRAKAEAYNKQQKSVAEYDQEMEVNAKQVEEWKRKADAYDMGVEMWAVYSEGGFCCVSADVSSNAWLFAEQYFGASEELLKQRGYTCRKVRVCEVLK